MIRKTKGGKKHEEENDSFSFMNMALMFVVFLVGMAAGHFILPMLLGSGDTGNTMMDSVKSLTSSITGQKPNTLPAPVTLPVPATAPATAPASTPTYAPTSAPVSAQLGGSKKLFKNKYR